MVNVSDYDNWQRRINGEDLPIYEDEIECGFYKVRLAPRSKQYLPVIIWKDGDKYFAQKNGKFVNAEYAFSSGVKNPISEQEYNELMETYNG